jgi:hypothetical protein
MIVANTYTCNYEYKSSSQLKKIEETKTRCLQVHRLRKNNPISDCIIIVNKNRDCA